MLRVSVRGGSVTLGYAVPINRTPCWSLLRLLEAFCSASRPMERVRGLVYLVFLTGAYRPPLVPAEASVDEIAGIRDLGSVEERDLHLLLEGVGVHPLARLDKSPPPIPIFDHLGSISWIGLRIWASHSPLQSPMPAIISPISLDALKWSDDSVAALRDSATFEDFLDDLAAIPSLRSVIRPAELVEKMQFQTLVGLRVPYYERFGMQYQYEESGADPAMPFLDPTSLQQAEMSLRRDLYHGGDRETQAAGGYDAEDGYREVISDPSMGANPVSLHDSPRTLACMK